MPTLDDLALYAIIAGGIGAALTPVVIWLATERYIDVLLNMRRTLAALDKREAEARPPSATRPPDA